MNQNKSENKKSCTIFTDEMLMAVFSFERPKINIMMQYESKHDKSSLNEHRSPKYNFMINKKKLQKNEEKQFLKCNKNGKFSESKWKKKMFTFRMGFFGVCS